MTEKETYLHTGFSTSTPGAESEEVLALVGLEQNVTQASVCRTCTDPFGSGCCACLLSLVASELPLPCGTWRQLRLDPPVRFTVPPSAYSPAYILIDHCKLSLTYSLPHF
jgi:hypothetical protein